MCHIFAIWLGFSGHSLLIAFLNRNVLSCFLKMARLLLVLIVNGSEFHKTGAARAKVRSPSVEQLTFGTNTEKILQPNEEHN